MSAIRLPRAYFPGCSTADIDAVELHIFTDASEEAYAATAYFRAVINGNVYCALVMAKAKVAPEYPVFDRFRHLFGYFEDGLINAHRQRKKF